MSNWISVDELPDVGHSTRSRAVLIYCPSNQCIFTACYNFENREWEYFARGSVEVNEIVSHWMPLPDPPTTGESE